MDTRNPTRGDAARNPLSDIIGLERCNIRIRPDDTLHAVELAVVAADGSARCLLARPSVYKLCAALLMAVSALEPEGDRWTSDHPLHFVAADPHNTPRGMGGGTIAAEGHHGGVGVRIKPAGGRAFVLLLTPAAAIALAAQLVAAAPGGEP